MCKSGPSGPSQAEIDLMNAQTQQIKDQQALIKQQDEEAAAQRAQRQQEIAAEKAADVRKQEQARTQKKRTSSTAAMYSGTSLLNPTASTGSLIRRGAA